MKKIPKSILDHISNAKYYREAADKHPTPTQDAINILLLIIGWENIVIANEELKSWATNVKVAGSFYKSHSVKLKKIPQVTRIVLGPSGTKPVEINVSKGKDFEKLRMMCQYGSNTETKEVKELFKSGWHTDGLRNGLIAKIRWVEMLIEIYEDLIKQKTEAVSK